VPGGGQEGGRMEANEILENAVLDAVAALLANKGWCVVVIGGMRIERHRDAEFRYGFVVDFTGGPPAPAAAPGEKQG
jgi:hypothetical protein